MSQRQSFANPDRLVFVLIAGITLSALVGIFFVASREAKNTGNNQAVTYEANASDKPNAETSGEFSNFGMMKVTEEKTAVFTIRNSGTKPLQLFGVTTSCDCTFATLTIKGAKSPEFSMHTKSDWTGAVEPGSEAQLDIVYRPSVMPVKGAVTRVAYVQTNDPQNPRLAFTIKAIVE